MTSINTFNDLIKFFNDNNKSDYIDREVNDIINVTNIPNGSICEYKYIEEFYNIIIKASKSYNNLLSNFNKQKAIMNKFIENDNINRQIKMVGSGGESKPIQDEYNTDIELVNYDENKNNKIKNKFVRIIIYKDTKLKDIPNPEQDVIYITSDDFDNLKSPDFYKYINAVYVYYNTSIIELFYNVQKFTKICILLLLYRAYPTLNIEYTTINTSLSFLYYQFLVGGFIRLDQIDIIQKILTNYSFDNMYLNVIRNTYKDIGPINGEVFSKTDKSLNNMNTTREIYNLIMGAGKTKLITKYTLCNKF